jgi:hypothetical protein
MDGRSDKSDYIHFFVPCGTSVRVKKMLAGGISALFQGGEFCNGKTLLPCTAEHSLNWQYRGGFALVHSSRREIIRCRQMLENIHAANVARLDATRQFGTWECYRD